MRQRKKIMIERNSEFELDLAPLLAVMVKLVPVLLISSAFVQMMIIETELPQVVKEALLNQNKNSAVITMDVNYQNGITINTDKDGKRTQLIIALDGNKKINLNELHAKLIEIKKLHPTVFKIELNPSAEVVYNDIIKILDEARKSKSTDINFPITDEKTGQTTMTDFMFPEVIFTNAIAG